MGTAMDFKFCTHIHSVDLAMKNFGHPYTGRIVQSSLIAFMFNQLCAQEKQQVLSNKHLIKSQSATAVIVQGSPKLYTTSNFSNFQQNLIIAPCWHATAEEWRQRNTDRGIC